MIDTNKMTYAETLEYAKLILNIEAEAETINANFERKFPGWTLTVNSKNTFNTPKPTKIVNPAVAAISAAIDERNNGNAIDKVLNVNTKAAPAGKAKTLKQLVPDVADYLKKNGPSPIRNIIVNLLGEYDYTKHNKVYQALCILRKQNLVKMFKTVHSEDTCWGLPEHEAEFNSKNQISSKPVNTDEGSKDLLDTIVIYLSENGLSRCKDISDFFASCNIGYWKVYGALCALRETNKIKLFGNRNSFCRWGLPEHEAEFNKKSAKPKVALRGSQNNSTIVNMIIDILKPRKKWRMKKIFNAAKYRGYPFTLDTFRQTMYGNPKVFRRTTRCRWMLVNPA